MRQTKKVSALLLICVMALAVLTGCGNSFDASKYVQAQLDNSYKNDSTLALEQKLCTAEEASALYEEVLDQQVDGFFYGVNVSDDLKARYRTIFADMLAKADYTVGEAEKGENNTHSVSIEYKKMKIFEPAIGTTMEKVEELDATDMDQFQEDFFALMADCLEEELAKGLEYGDAQTMTMRVEIQNKTYVLNTDDVNSLSEGLFDTEAIDAAS